MNQEFKSGALLDERPENEKQQDKAFVEIVAGASPVNWVEKPQDQWRKFPIFDQDGSGSCVAQTMRKILGVLHWLKHSVFINFSATHIYQRRANKPGYGMSGYNVFDIAQQGVTLNDFALSDGLSDAQMDGEAIEQYKQDVGKVFAIGDKIVLPIQDIETIASVIQITGKAVMVWFFWNTDEWMAVPKVLHPELTKETAQGVHSVTAVDFTIYEGEKALVIDESWNKTAGFNGQRVIKESFYKARNFFAAYPMAFKFDQPQAQPAKPHYTFTKELDFIPLNSSGQISDPIKNAAQHDDVTALQDILKYEGLFPQNTQSTGYYGAVTAQAVLAFQRRYQVADETELASLGGRVVGVKTRSKLNTLYGN